MLHAPYFFPPIKVLNQKSTRPRTGHHEGFWVCRRSKARSIQTPSLFWLLCFLLFRSTDYDYVSPTHFILILTMTEPNKAILGDLVGLSEKTWEVLHGPAYPVATTMLLSVELLQVLDSNLIFSRSTHLLGSVSKTSCR